MKESNQNSKEIYRINRKMARTFLKVLKGKDVLVWLLLHDQKKGPPQMLFGSLEEVWPQLREAQKKGYGIFITVNDSDGKGRKTENMVKATAVFVDGDGIPRPSLWEIPPHIIVQRDATHWHAYWLIEPTNDFARWRLIQKSLAECLGTDPVISDPPRVMRVPGFYHQKGDPILVRLKKCVAPEALEKGQKKRLTLSQIETGFSLEIPKSSSGTKRKSKVSGKGKTKAAVLWDRPAAIQKAIQFLQDSAPVAVQGENGNNTLYVVAAHLKDWAISEKKVGSLLLEHWNPRCLPPWTEGELREIVRHAFEYGQNTPGRGSGQKSSKKAFALCLDTLEQAKLDLAFNEFSERYVLRAPNLPWKQNIGRELNEEILRLIRHSLIKQFDFTAKKDDLLEAAKTLALQNRFHPVRDYLKSLQWDGVKRLDTWMIVYLSAEDSPYTQAVGIKTLLAAVARVFEPGCKFDVILVLEGRQGSGKSWVIKILAGEKWFGDAPLTRLEDADAVAKIQGVWLYELSELVTVKKNEVESFKAFITRTHDRARMPYERVPRDYPRQGVFIGTTNSLAYLLDPTGNRRFWPVRTGKIDLEGLARDRDQLWAEAYTRWAGRKESLVLDPSLHSEAERQQEHRRVEDAWEDEIRTYLENKKLTKVFTKEIMEGCLLLNRSQQHQGVTRRLRGIMEGLGWTYKKAIRIKNENRAGYVNFIEDEPL